MQSESAETVRCPHHCSGGGIGQSAALGTTLQPRLQVDAVALDLRLLGCAPELLVAGRLLEALMSMSTALGVVDSCAGPANAPDERSLLRSSSSLLRVPEVMTSWPEDAAIRKYAIEAQLHVTGALNSSKMTSSIWTRCRRAPWREW
jgi:hypothetical protein